MYNCLQSPQAVGCDELLLVAAYTGVTTITGDVTTMGGVPKDTNVWMSSTTEEE